MWRKIFKNFLPCILVLVAAGFAAQEDKLIRAQQLLKAKESDQAVLAIDSAVLHPDTKGDFMAWTTRAFIYFDLYKRSDRLKLNNPLRDTIISSLRISQSLKPDSNYQKNNLALLTNMAAGYFNLGKMYLQDSLNAAKSQQAYNKYKEVYELANPGSNMKGKDIEYYLAVGSLFSEIFIKDNNNTAAGEVAKVALLKTLEIQPDNPNASINMGLMYYNQAVNLTKSMEYGADFDQIEIVQENIVKLAKQSEQFIVKVYNQDNKNAKAIEALYYIYRMLNDFPKSDDFKAKCTALGIDVSQKTADNQEGNK